MQRAHVLPDGRHANLRARQDLLRGDALYGDSARGSEHDVIVNGNNSIATIVSVLGLLWQPDITRPAHPEPAPHGYAKFT